MIVVSLNGHGQTLVIVCSSVSLSHLLLPHSYITIVQWDERHTIFMSYHKYYNWVTIARPLQDKYTNLLQIGVDFEECGIEYGSDQPEEAPETHLPVQIQPDVRQNIYHFGPARHGPLFTHISIQFVFLFAFSWRENLCFGLHWLCLLVWQRWTQVDKENVGSF